ITATLLTLALTGAAKATLLSDSGAVVRWGRPLISVLVDIASAVTMGGTMLLAFVLPRTHGAWERVRVMVMVSAPAWTVALAAQIFFSYAATAGRPLGAPGFIDELLYYVTELGAGRARLTALVLAALTSVVMAAISGYGTALFAWVMSVSVIIPVAVTGHAAGAENHDLAMNASFMHIVGAGLWVGGLLCLIAAFGLLQDPDAQRQDPKLRRQPKPVTLTEVATRYSSIASWAFVAVAVSGVANSVIRIGEISDLATPYGYTVIAKTVAFILIVVAGWWHRQFTIGQLADRPKTFWRLAISELLIM